MVRRDNTFPYPDNQVRIECCFREYSGGRYKFSASTHWCRLTIDFDRTSDEEVKYRSNLVCDSVPEIQRSKQQLGTIPMQNIN